MGLAADSMDGNCPAFGRKAAWRYADAKEQFLGSCYQRGIDIWHGLAGRDVPVKRLTEAQIADALKASKYGDKTENTYEQVIGHSVYIQTVLTGQQAIHRDAKHNAAKAILLEAMVREILVELEEVKHRAGKAYEGCVNYGSTQEAEELCREVSEQGFETLARAKAMVGE